MDYHEEFIIDFARRTRANLDAIESFAGEGMEVFEVTQLANSLLGLLVFPREHYMHSIPDTPLSELVKRGWPNIQTTHGKLDHETLHQLMRVLRNSIAHCNVEFTSDADLQITGIKLWNNRWDKEAKKSYKTWQAELSIADLRAVALKFIELIEQGSNREACE